MGATDDDGRLLDSSARGAPGRRTPEVEPDRRLGSLWDTKQCRVLAEHIERGCLSVMARVYG